MVADEDIGAIARSEPELDKACEKLIAAANANGGVDNITVVLARIEPL
jgi:serine/threonine protein phosphatase PrpC